MYGVSGLSTLSTFKASLPPPHITDGTVPVRANGLREVLRSGRPAVGAWMSIDSPYLAEVLSHAGYDTVTVDLQHGMFGIGSAIALLQAVSAGPAMPMARCPSHDPAVIGKLLDGGAYGVICPGVDSAEQAAAFVSACRYPPTGTRSYGPSRGLLYGGPDYVDHADETISTWAMVESTAGLANLDAILATPGLDGVYVGPNDLALALGERPGLATPPPPVQAALSRVAAAAHSAGRYCGVFCADPLGARAMIEVGFDFVTPGNDAGVLKRAAAEALALARGDGAPGRPAGGGY